LVADRFDSGVFSDRHATDPVGGQESFSLVTPPAAWEVRFTNVDLNASSAFVAGNHYMDVIYDGGTATRTLEDGRRRKRLPARQVKSSLLLSFKKEVLPYFPTSTE